MHHRRFCNERVPWVLDLTDKVDFPSTGYRIRSFRWQRRAQRPLRSLHWQCHLQILCQIQARCIQNSRDSQCLRSCRGRGGLRKSNWGSSFFVRGNVFLFSIENYVAELLLCAGGYRGAGCESALICVAAMLNVRAGYESILDGSTRYV